MNNLRRPALSSDEAEGIVKTILGPDAKAFRKASLAVPDLTLDQRQEWWRLVKSGVDVNVALATVRSLL